MRAPVKKTGRKNAAPAISVRLSDRVMLEAQADGSLDAWFDGYSTGLGNFSAAAIGRAQDLSTGLRLSSFSPDGKPVEKEIDVLVRRLARRGLVEYRLAHPADAKELVAIEPQLPDYWPRTLKPDNADVIALSRFAYLRRRGGEMVLESPRAGALFRIGDPKIASILALLATPQKISRLRRQDGFPGMEFLGLLMDCRILFKVEAEGDGFRADEGDDNLVLWDFHDLLFHARSTEGRQANPIGGLYPFAGIMPPPPAVRPSWPGKQIDMDGFLDGFNALSEPLPGIAGVLRERHSVRDFDDTRPVTLTELSRFLDGSARILSKWESPLDPEDGDSPLIDYTTRPYPSGGSSYELELYLAAANCEGLTRGFYHYDAGRHALTPIDVRPQDFDAMLTSAELAMDAPGAPQILITIAARFGRISWKYSGLAYSLILKDVGVLMQTFYMVATGMGLGGCAIGTNNIELFAKMTHIDFHVEGPVGQFAVGRALPDQP